MIASVNAPVSLCRLISMSATGPPPSCLAITPEANMQNTSTAVIQCSTFAVIRYWRMA